MSYAWNAVLLVAASLAIAWAWVCARRAAAKAREFEATLANLEEEVAQRTSQLERSNRKLREAKDEAEETNRAKSQFLASMSHEIRTPLTSILGYADLLVRSDPGPQKRLKNLQTIRRNGQHLLELINDVLDISKIEAGEMTVELLECSPWQLAREVRSLLKPQAEAKDLTFEIEASGPIPEYIQSDPVRLRQILLNLVGNAIKFTEKGGVRVVVRMEEPGADAAGGPRLTYDVIDTGIGMTGRQKESAFMPFRQASSSMPRVYGGTGLGLAISRRLARMLDGDITVESVPEVGSTFSLTVDAGALDDTDMLEGPLRAETMEGLPAPTGWWTKRLGGRVLLAEDGVDNRHFISAVLQQVGADVTLVENGRQAVDQALSSRAVGKPFDAVLMDMQMPVLDGFDAVQELRGEGYEGSIVALTAYAMKGDREKCLEVGCDDFVSKPIDVESFLALLARYVSPGSAPPSEAPMPESAPEAAGSSSAGDGPLVSTLAAHPKLATLVRDFAGRLPERVEQLQEAFLKSDFETLRTLAHSLRGAGGTYGFKPLSEAADELESRIDGGAEHAEIAAALARVAEVCERATAGAEN